MQILEPEAVRFLRELRDGQKPYANYRLMTTLAALGYATFKCNLSGYMVSAEITDRGRDYLNAEDLL